MNQPPPLTPEEIAMHQAASPAEYGQPQTVKVFGILHVVFASLGLISTIFGIVSMLFSDKIYGLMGSGPALEAQAKAQAAMQEDMMGTNIFSTILTLVIAGLMLTAGIKLLRKQRSALIWSNRYAWASIVGKVYTLAVSVFFILPKISKMMVMPPSAKSTLESMEWVMASTMLGGIVLSMTYPILTLVLLNRKTTKDWLAQQPN